MYAVSDHVPHSVAGVDDIGIVAIAASMGGIDALSCILADLPADFPVPIVVVQHLSAVHPSALVDILKRHSVLRVKWASDGETLMPGLVYIAPRNRHLTVASPGVVALEISERVNWVRPAADVLFQSVAHLFGRRALAIVLTGCLHDGAAGAVSIKRAGGWVLAQDERTSCCFDMPRAAIGAGAVDFVLSLDNLPFAIRTMIATFGATSLISDPTRLAAAPDSSLLQSGDWGVSRN